MSTDCPSAIPTVYNGQQYRSRLESTVAWLLDAMGLEFQYEPQSFLLPNGVQYMPDFFVPAQDLWIEARGYDSPKGRKQILGFCEYLYGDECWGMETHLVSAPNFLIVGPHSMGLATPWLHWYPAWAPGIYVGGADRSFVTFTPSTDRHADDAWFVVTFEDGRICVWVGHQDGGPRRKHALPDEDIWDCLGAVRESDDGR